jgi:tetratricopeptide (TPR) repeat protein
MRILFLVSALLFYVFVSPGSAELGQAEQYYLQGKWAKAVQEYMAVADEDLTVETLNKFGEAYYFSGDLSAAENAFKRAMALKDNPESAILIAMVHAVRDKRKISDLQGLSDTYGESALLFKALGAAHLKHKDHSGAMGYLLLSVKKDPGDYMTHFYIGLVRERKHRYDSAIEAYKKSLKINPVFAQAVNNVGYCYKERRYYTYAIEMYKKAIDMEPDNASFHYNLGNALTHKKRVKEAFTEYVHAVELSPKFAKAHYNLGRSYIEMDMHEEGIKSLELYLKYWDKSLSGSDAPPRDVVRDEIAVLKDIIKYGAEEGED